MRKRSLVKKLKTSLSIGLAAAMLVSGFSGAIPASTANATENKSAAKTASTMRNVMYYGDWSIWGGQGNFYPQDIPADQLTHLNYAFMDFDSQANLIYCDKDAATAASLGQPGVTWGDINSGILPALINLKAANPNLKIGISLGGWSKSGDFSTVAANPALRKKLVDNTIKFIEYTNMDFVDIDWEYPGCVRDGDKVDSTQDEGTLLSTSADKENYILLLQDFRAALDKKGAEIGKTYELSVALPAPSTKLEAGIDIPKLFEVVDFANMMTYDMRGAWDSYSGHQTSLFGNPADPYYDSGYTVDQTVKYLLANGAVADKIVIGAAFYTRGWEKVEAGNNASLPGLFGEAALCAQDADQSPSRGALNEAPLKVGEGGRRGGVWSYRSIDDLKTKYTGLKEYWDDTAKAPYLYDSASGAFFTYDNVRSVQEKAKYVKANNLGGMIAWMASQDKPTAAGSKVRDELTNTMKQGLFGNAELAKHEFVSADLDITTTITTAESWSNSSIYSITFKNNESKTESGDVLQSVENIHKTIKLPKLYIKTDANIISGTNTAGAITKKDGYVVLDLQAVSEARTIKPGATYSLELKTNTPDASATDIESIEITQCTCFGGVEYGRQTIHGDSNKNYAPVLNGVSDKTVYVDDSFDAMDNVTAYDKESGDLTGAIKVSGSVDTSKEGTYELVYTVTDGEYTTTAVRVITVKEKVNEAPVISGADDITLNLGDSFDDMANVTAYDKESGDLTGAIKVSGSVDTSKEGTYELVYTVTDGVNTTTAVRLITVKEKVNEAPVISGVKDSTINIGDSFDAMAGVTAADAEDGDLTNAVTIIGEVDTATVGEYPLTYSVSDSNGLEVSASCVVTVTDEIEEFDPGKIYLKGDKVRYKGKVWIAQWWVQGGIPGQDSAWLLHVVPNEDGSVDYVAGTAYVTDQKVKYEGKIYIAKWWTTSIPGSDDSWK